MKIGVIVAVLLVAFAAVAVVGFMTGVPDFFENFGKDDQMTVTETETETEELPGEGEDLPAGTVMRFNDGQIFANGSPMRASGLKGYMFDVTEVSGKTVTLYSDTAGVMYWNSYNAQESAPVYTALTDSGNGVYSASFTVPEGVGDGVFTVNAPASANVIYVLS